MPDVLIFGDSKSAYLRHELPLSLPDPAAYIERDGRRYAIGGSLDMPRLEALGALDVISFEELGLDEALAGGTSLAAGLDDCLLRALRRLGVTDACVPADFPLGTADHLRAGGVAVLVDAELFGLRRRSKTAEQIEGVRRAQRVAELAMESVRAGLREGGDLSSEELRAGAKRVFVDNGCVPHDLLVLSCGPQSALIHDEGAGPIRPHEPILVDIFPRDAASGCWGDITRTFCVGQPPAELIEYHRLVREAQLRACETVRPGISAGEPYRIACEVFEAAGYQTRRTKAEGTVLEDGFAHYLGHGLGLDLHEAPTLDDGGETLVPGDVITIEPGLYRRGFGGCRLEDVLLVTEDGYELLTSFPYELAP